MFFKTDVIVPALSRFKMYLWADAKHRAANHHSDLERRKEHGDSSI